MSEVKYCACQSPMSNYESERYGKCTGCWNEEQSKKATALADQREIEKVEKERLEKEAKERKIQEQRNRFIAQLKALEGKTVESVDVVQWTKIDKDEALESVRIQFTDGSNATFSKEEFADGCRGSYDYYRYLEVDTHIAEPENEVSEP